MSTWIYRITHYSNLDFILKNGIHCCNSNTKDPNFINIGDTSLINSRGITTVPIHPSGVLNDYVPFYFGVHSPMLYKIYKGSVQNVSATQSDIIYLATTVEQIVKTAIPFVFTDGHAKNILSSYYNNIKDLNKLDSTTIVNKFWNNTPEDNDKQRRKQAEFLAFNSVPMSCILGIGVYDDPMKVKIDGILTANKSQHIPCKIKSEWYY